MVQRIREIRMLPSSCPSKHLASIVVLPHNHCTYPCTYIGFQWLFRSFQPLNACDYIVMIVFGFNLVRASKSWLEPKIRKAGAIRKKAPRDVCYVRTRMCNERESQRQIPK